MKLYKRKDKINLLPHEAADTNNCRGLIYQIRVLFGYYRQCIFLKNGNIVKTIYIILSNFNPEEYIKFEKRSPLTKTVSIFILTYVMYITYET